MLIESAGKRFEIPPEGRHAAVLADIYSLGIRPTKFGNKERICWRWLLELTNSEGRRYSAFQHFNRTLAEGSFLRAAVEMFVGSLPPNPVFDLDTLLGSIAIITLVHEIGQDKKPFARITEVIPTKDHLVAIPDGFRRRQDRIKN